MVAPTPEFTPVQCYIIPGTNERLYVSLNILNVDMQSKTFHAVLSAYTLIGAMQTVFDVQEHQGQLQAAPAPLQALANGLLDDADPIDNRPGNGALSVDVGGLTTEQMDEAAAKLKKVMEEFTEGLKAASTEGKHFTAVRYDTPSADTPKT